MTVRALPVLAVPLIICCLGLGLAAPLAPPKKLLAASFESGPASTIAISS